MRKTTIAIIIISMFLLGCASPDTPVSSNTGKTGKGNGNVNIEEPTPQEQQECSADSDCVPIPSCHPRACINKEFVSKYRMPEMCTEMFDCSAAYDASACGCVNGRCLNLNLGDKGCEGLPE